MRRLLVLGCGFNLVSGLDFILSKNICFSQIDLVIVGDISRTSEIMTTLDYLEISFRTVKIFSIYFSNNIIKNNIAYILWLKKIQCWFKNLVYDEVFIGMLSNKIRIMDHRRYIAYLCIKNNKNINLFEISDGLLCHSIANGIALDYTSPARKFKEKFIYFLMGYSDNILLATNFITLSPFIERKPDVLLSLEYFVDFIHALNKSDKNTSIHSGAVLILGQPLSESGILSQDLELQNIKKILEIFPNKNILYYPHPSESKNKLSNLSALNLKLVNRKLIFEVFFSIHANSFDVCITYHSTAILIAKKINKNIDLYYYSDSDAMKAFCDKQLIL